MISQLMQNPPPPPPPPPLMGPPPVMAPYQQPYAGQRVYAGFWIRLVARSIDGFIIGIPPKHLSALQVYLPNLLQFPSTYWLQ